MFNNLFFTTFLALFCLVNITTSTQACSRHKYSSPKKYFNVTGKDNLKYLPGQKCWKSVAITTCCFEDLCRCIYSEFKPNQKTIIAFLNKSGQIVPLVFETAAEDLSFKYI